MSDIVVQASFNSGEWAPALYARVDIQKYKSGAALLQNFFVDYRGGASSRPGTKYINQAYKSATPVRLIRFQASFNVGYVLEFGDKYIRFYYQGAAVLETGFAITAATQANPCVITVTGNNYAIGDWIYITGVVGMTQLNGLFFEVLNVSGASVTLGDLQGNNIDSTGYTAYSSGGLAQRDYTLVSPYAAADLALVKFAPSVNLLVLTHPNYPPQALTLNSATNWTISTIIFGSTSVKPTGLATTVAGSTNIYGVTSLDINGQESNAAALTAGNYPEIISWTASGGAVAYNVYRFGLNLASVPVGSNPGFIGTTQGLSFQDVPFAPDYSITPPVAQNPFFGSGIASVTVTAGGAYTGLTPSVSFTGVSPGASASAVCVVTTVSASIQDHGASYNIGDDIRMTDGSLWGVLGTSSGQVTSIALISPATFTGPVPSNPVQQQSTTGHGFAFSLNMNWTVIAVNIIQPGAGYPSVPTVSFSGGGSAAGTASLAPPALTNPAVPGFFQERLILAAPPTLPQTFWASKPGSYYNYDISFPSNASNSITSTLVSGELNTIKSIVSSTAGMLILTDKGSWLVNGGSSGSAISPSSIVANAQSFIGANDVPPIVANYDVLYVQSKGAGVRDLAFNIYFSVFTGTDISILSSHLFFGYEILEWAWAESPFYTVWAIRNDGVMLSLTYLKEQEFIGWAQHNTTPGLFMSVATVTEATPTIPFVDAVYVVVQRVINGNTVRYIERMSERIYPNIDAMGWCVDCGLSYSGSAQTTFTGAQYLAGQTVTGVADGVVIPPFIMPLSGTFTLGTPATDVIVGLPYSCNLQTLPLDVGDPSIQGKVKKIPYVDVRVNQTLGLQIGPDFSHLQPMKDLIQGNVGSQLTGLNTSQVVSGLYSGDARTFLGSAYTIPGQYCIQQSLPLPASILGVFPALVQGDDR